VCPAVQHNRSWYGKLHSNTSSSNRNRFVSFPLHSPFSSPLRRFDSDWNPQVCGPRPSVTLSVSFPPPLPFLFFTFQYWSALLLYSHSLFCHNWTYALHCTALHCTVLNCTVLPCHVHLLDLSPHPTHSPPIWSLTSPPHPFRWIFRPWPVCTV
jgi:hypothetical protein